MNMSSESLLVILFVGLVAGWLAGQIVRGTGFGIVGDLIIGILGAFIGSWLRPSSASISAEVSSARSSMPPSARYCCSSWCGFSAVAVDGEADGAAVGDGNKSMRSGSSSLV